MPRGVQLFSISLSALIGLAFLIFTCAMFFHSVVRGRKQAEAEILSAAVESYEDTDADGNTATLFRSISRIRYSAEGRTYELPFWTSTGTSNRASVEQKVRGNPIGSRRPIFYLPDRPDDFEYQPLIRRIGFSLLTFSVGITVLGVAVLLRTTFQPLDW